MKKIELLHFTVAKKISVNCSIFLVICSNPVKPGLTGFEQLIKFVSSNWYAAKSVEQMSVEQSQFEQFTPTQLYVTQFPKTRENMYEEILILVLKGSPNKLWLTILVPPNFTKINLPSRALFENNFSFLPLQKLGLTHGKKYGSRILKLCI